MNITLSLPSAVEDLLHRDQRAERVAVGVLVRDDDQLLGAAQLGEHLRRGSSGRRSQSSAPACQLVEQLA